MRSVGLRHYCDSTSTNMSKYICHNCSDDDELIKFTVTKNNSTFSVYADMCPICGASTDSDEVEYL